MQSISLHSNAGGSDKLYNVFLVPQEDGYVVNYQNGRRGSTMTNGTKTATPVPLAKAQGIFEKLVKEKMTGSSKYQVIEGAAPTAAVAAAAEKKSSGFDPQLLNAIDRARAEELIRDDAYLAQQKFDGERRPVMFVGGIATGINKKGEAVPLLKTFEDELKRLGVDVLFDGEHVGEKLYVFDVLMNHGRDLKNASVTDRISKLDGYHATRVESSPFVFVETAYDEAEKRQLFNRVASSGGEGVVFKRKDALYQPGRPSSGGDHLKFKFVESATVQVIAHSEGVRSVEMAVYDGEQCLSLKNVTIPPSANIPAVGSFIEVQYLYAWPSGGLAQPVFLKPRTDVDRGDCTLAQLKFKKD